MSNERDMFMMITIDGPCDTANTECAFSVIPFLAWFVLFGWPGLDVIYYFQIKLYWNSSWIPRLADSVLSEIPFSDRSRGAIDFRDARDIMNPSSTVWSCHLNRLIDKLGKNWKEQWQPISVPNMFITSKVAYYFSWFLLLFFHNTTASVQLHKKDETISSFTVTSSRGGRSLPVQPLTRRNIPCTTRYTDDVDLWRFIFRKSARAALTISYPQLLTAHGFAVSAQEAEEVSRWSVDRGESLPITRPSHSKLVSASFMWGLCKSVEEMEPSTWTGGEKKSY